MSRQLFVVPESVTLPLFDDGQYWISVKRQLNAGEARQLAQAPLSRVAPTGSPDNPGVIYDLDLEAGAFAKVLIYLDDWNLVNANNKTMAIDTPKAKRDAVKALHPDVLREIERVIDAHVLAQQQEKKPQPGSPMPSSISPSPAG